MIDSLGLAGFFLLHRDLLELAREVAVQVRGPSSVRALLPPGRGRGSSVSSIVCYLTGLSHIDPISNELFLGRFLNEELTSLPDIDLDFPRDIREVLIPRVHDRYGREHSALVAAFPTFRSRGAIRELGKVLGLPPGELERVARGAEPFAVRGVAHDVESALGLEHGGPPPALNDPDNRAPFAMSTEEWMAMVNGLDPADVAERIPDETRFAALPGRWSWLARLCDEAYGLPRHLSQHSGGMIVSTRPLVDCCPVVPAAMEGRQLCQWDKDSCADAGFLKIDLLGPRDAVGGRALRGVHRAHARRADRPLAHPVRRSRDLHGDPGGRHDGGLPDRVARADAVAVPHAAREPGRHHDPGRDRAARADPRRRRQPVHQAQQLLREDPDYEVPYDHPSLEPVLRDTLGTIIFQDQVIEVAMAFAGFSPGEAEGLRRAMSRKRSAAAIEGYHRRFVEGAAATHGVDEETAERVYTMIVGFSGFGFPKAHGAAFGLLAYQSTWLRVHHGPEFLCALLNEQPMGFYAPDTLAHEAQRRGIEMAPPDVNASEVECTVETIGPPARVRIGLGYVLGVRRDEVEALVAARRERGPFRSLADLASRAGAGRPALEKLAWAGACDALGGSRRTALWQLGVAAPGERCPRGHAARRCRSRCPPRPSCGRSTAWEGMVADYATTGLTLGPHPLKLLRGGLAAATVSCEDLPRLPHETPVRIGGLVVARQRPGHRQGDRLHPARGRVRDGQPDRAAAGVRAPPADRADSEPLILAEGRLERLPQAGRRDQRLRARPASAGRAGRRRRRTWSRWPSGGPRPQPQPPRRATSGGSRRPSRASRQGGGDERAGVPRRANR